MNITGSLNGGGRTSHIASVSFDIDEATMARMSKRMRDGVWAMAYGVRERAMFRAPVLTGALWNTIRVEPMTDEGITIAAGGIFGTGSDGISRLVDYAYKREMSNGAHPWTMHYMENGLKDVLESDWQNTYFKGVTQ